MRICPCTRGQFTLVAAFALVLGSVASSLQDHKARSGPQQPSSLHGHRFHLTGDVHSIKAPHAASVDVTEAFMFVAVTSIAHLPDRRRHQRKQWQRSLQILSASALPDDDYPFIFNFVVGTQLTASIRESIQAEVDAYHDILLLDGPDFDTVHYSDIGADGTSSTTLKVLGAVRWAHHHFKFKYFLRLGDDSYFRPDQFLRTYLDGKLPTKNAMFGYLAGPHQYRSPAGDLTHRYLYGLGFCMTAEVADFIATQNPDYLLLGGPEDVIVSSWLVGTRFQMLQQEGFRDMSWPCADPQRDIVVHYLTTGTDWDAIDVAGVLNCTRELEPFTGVRIWKRFL